MMCVFFVAMVSMCYSAGVRNYKRGNDDDILDQVAQLLVNSKRGTFTGGGKLICKFIDHR